MNQLPYQQRADEPHVTPQLRVQAFCRCFIASFGKDSSIHEVLIKQDNNINSYMISD